MSAITIATIAHSNGDSISLISAEIHRRSAAAA